MLKIGILIGTRPEAIKLAPVAIAAGQHGGIDARVIATGQHADMCASIFSLFGIAPSYQLGIMKPGQTLTDISVGVLEKLQALFADWRPDWLIVQGDTSSAFTGGLAAFYAGVKVAHVEAGLRSGNVLAPWPEEMNRLLLSRIATLHFAPTPSNADTLRREQVKDSDILVTGNTGIDALHRLRQMLASDPGVRKQAEDALKAAGIAVPTRPYVLVTAHRRESFGADLDNIMRSVARLAKRFPDHDFIYPVHPNPAVRASVDAQLRSSGGNVVLSPPLDYLPFVALMLGAELLLTDSGGRTLAGQARDRHALGDREAGRSRHAACPLVRGGPCSDRTPCQRGSDRPMAERYVAVRHLRRRQCGRTDRDRHRQPRQRGLASIERPCDLPRHRAARNTPGDPDQPPSGPSQGLRHSPCQRREARRRSGQGHRWDAASSAGSGSSNR
jgi:UDP-N-acetylglucosamine 2-epimerase (non-hydrolysing)